MYVICRREVWPSLASKAHGKYRSPGASTSTVLSLPVASHLPQQQGQVDSEYPLCSYCSGQQPPWGPILIFVLSFGGWENKGICEVGSSFCSYLWFSLQSNVRIIFCIWRHLLPHLVAHTFSPKMSEAEEAGLCEVEGSLVYTLSSWATSETLSQNSNVYMLSTWAKTCPRKRK